VLLYLNIMLLYNLKLTKIKAMKKLVMLFAGILLLSGPLYAQDESSGEGSSGGAGSGDVLIELTGTPFNTGGGFLDFSEFRARYFLSDDMAVRLGLYMSLDNNQRTPDEVVNNSVYSIMPGFEYHLINEGGFRSYTAADLMIGQRIANFTSSTGESVVGASRLVDFDTQISDTQRSSFSFGARVGLGAEYYFGKRFYIGGEIGFQYGYRKNADVFVDGDIRQTATKDNFGYFTTANSFKIGFRFLNF